MASLPVWGTGCPCCERVLSLLSVVCCARCVFVARVEGERPATDWLFVCCCLGFFSRCSDQLEKQCASESRFPRFFSWSFFFYRQNRHQFCSCSFSSLQLIVDDATCALFSSLLFSRKTHSHHSLERRQLFTDRIRRLTLMDCLLVRAKNGEREKKGGSVCVREGSSSTCDGKQFIKSYSETKKNDQSSLSLFDRRREERVRGDEKEHKPSPPLLVKALWMRRESQTPPLTHMLLLHQVMCFCVRERKKAHCILNLFTLMIMKRAAVKGMSLLNDACEFSWRMCGMPFHSSSHKFSGRRKCFLSVWEICLLLSFDPIHWILLLTTDPSLSLDGSLISCESGTSIIPSPFRMFHQTKEEEEEELSRLEADNSSLETRFFPYPAATHCACFQRQNLHIIDTGT